MCWANPARSTCSAVPIAAFARQAEAIGASAASSARCTRAQAEARCRLSVRTYPRRRIDERTPLPQDKRPKPLGACSTMYTNLERTRDWISPPSGASWAVSHGHARQSSTRANSCFVSPGAEPRSGVVCANTRPSSPRAAACDRRFTLRHGTSKLARPTRRPVAVRSACGGHTWSLESARRRLSSTTAAASDCEAGAHPGRRRPRMEPGHLLTTDAVRRQRLPPAARESERHLHAVR